MEPVKPRFHVRSVRSGPPGDVDAAEYDVITLERDFDTLSGLLGSARSMHGLYHSSSGPNKNPLIRGFRHSNAAWTLVLHTPAGGFPHAV